MSALRRLYWFFRPLKKLSREYGAEVLYSGWVDFPGSSK
jgi:hypothetical protein